jgi:hypothetical protein
MRPNNRQRSRGGRNGGGGGGGGGGHHHKQHHNPNRPPNRNQIFDSSGPDVRVRGNAHQVFDKYQALAREAASSGDRIMAEAYWQYADHYFRMIQSQGGFIQRNNQGWGDGGGEEGQSMPPQQGQGQGGPPQQANGNGQDHGERQGGREEQRGRPDQANREDQGDSEPGLGGVAFLQNGRTAPAEDDPAADEQPDVPEFTPTTGGRRR